MHVTFTIFLLFYSAILENMIYTKWINVIVDGIGPSIFDEYIILTPHHHNSNVDLLLVIIQVLISPYITVQLTHHPPGTCLDFHWQKNQNKLYSPFWQSTPLKKMFDDKQVAYVNVENLYIS